MKIIDLLNEREKLSKENFKLTYNALFLPAKSSDEDRNVNRQYQDKVKRYNELTDRINEAYARTRINVTGYGEISLATAVGYCRDKCWYSDGSSDDSLVALLLEEDYQKDLIQTACWNDNPVFPTPQFDISPETSEENRKNGRECFRKIESLKNTMFCDLKAAIIKAISDTEV